MTSTATKADVQPGQTYYTNLNMLRNMPQGIVDLLLNYRAKVQNIASNRMISALAMKEQSRAAREGALNELDQMSQDAQRAADTLRIGVKMAIKPKLSTEEALLFEMRQQRAWDRHRGLLESGKTPLELIQRAADSADGEALMALEAELPAWMEARGNPSDLIKSTISEIRRLERPLLNDKQQLARDIESEVDKGLPQLTSAIEMARLEVSEGNHGAWGQTSIIPAWFFKETLTVEAK